MEILPIGTPVKFGNGDKITGTIVGHGTMMSPSKATYVTYAVRLDEQFQGWLGAESWWASYISTLTVCADGVTKI
jgi:hypothetical protein